MASTTDISIVLLHLNEHYDIKIPGGPKKRGQCIIFACVL